MTQTNNKHKKEHMFLSEPNSICEERSLREDDYKMPNRPTAFEGKRFYLIGEFKHVSKSELIDMLTKCGGTVMSECTQDNAIDYVIYGRGVKKMILNYLEKQCGVTLINEEGSDDYFFKLFQLNPEDYIG